MKLVTKIIKTIGIAVMLFSYACKDFVTINSPVDQIGTEKVYSSDETATAAIRGIYARMMTGGGFASGSHYSVTLSAGRSADDFVNHSTTDNKKQFSENNLLPENTFLRNFLWQDPYMNIYAANAVLENLAKSDLISAGLKQQLIGEAKFIRAFCHFYLTNLFGEIPLILTTDYRINAVSPASTVDQVYEQMIKDLNEAKVELSDNYPSSERIRANKWAATALLARVYLYHKEWRNAEEQANEVISKQNLYALNNELNDVFIKNNKEAILQFAAPKSLNLNTNDGNLFILDKPIGATSDVSLSADLLAAFEPGDERFNKWIGTFTNGSNSWKYPFKYKIKTGSSPLKEYMMVLRLAEQYLIRAEARINQNQVALGIADLNVLRERARALPEAGDVNPLPTLSIDLDKSDALLAVEKERRVELFSEWGHRWLDLKRTNRAEAILAPQKLQNWQKTDVWYPIPLSELLNNKKLNQNDGYE